MPLFGSMLVGLSSLAFGGDGGYVCGGIFVCDVQGAAPIGAAPSANFLYVFRTSQTTSSLLYWGDGVFYYCGAMRAKSAIAFVT